MNTTFQPYTKNIVKQFLAYISVLFLLFSFSCKDDANLIGANFFDNDKMEIKFDTTISFLSFLNEDEDFSTKNYSSVYIGNVNDPYFGSLKGSLAIQYFPLVLGDTIKSIIPDSAVIYFRIDDSYGIFDKSQHFNLYILSNSLIADSTYLNTTNIEDFYIDETSPINTSTYYSGDTLIAFPLSNTFIDYLKPDNNNLYDSLIHFRDFYKGLCIIPIENTGKGSMINLTLDSDESKISLFYNDTLTYDYTFSLGLNFSNYVHDHTGAIIDNYLQNDSTEVDTLMFIQGFGGMTSKIIFTDYLSWIDKAKYSIISAELLVPVYKDDDFDIFSNPNELYFLYPTSDTTFYYVSDDDPNYSDIFDGTYSENNDFYRFNISKHIKSILNGEITDSLLNIRMRDNYTNPGRVILKAGNNIKLKLTYTEH